MAQDGAGLVCFRYNARTLICFERLVFYRHFSSKRTVMSIRAKYREIGQTNTLCAEPRDGSHSL